MVPAPLHLMHVVGPRSSRDAACTEPNMRGKIDASPSRWNTHTAAGRWESPVRNIAKLNRNRLQGDEPMGRPQELQTAHPSEQAADDVLKHAAPKVLPSLLRKRTMSGVVEVLTCKAHGTELPDVRYRTI